MTLTELLLSGLASSIILTAAGTALFNMITQQSNIGNQIETRLNVSRAINFIKNESKQALSFEYTDSTTLANVAPTFVLPAGASVPLAMSLLNLPESIIYYVAPPPSNSLWQGPLVIYRWGPTLSTQGQYTDTDPSNWSTEPLVDMIDDTASTPNCATGWNVSPSSGSTGFYTCISADQKAAKIYINGEIEQTNANNTIYGDERALGTSVYKPSGIAPTPTQITSNPVVAAAPSCEVLNGILSCAQPATLTLEIIGDDFSCDGRNQNPILTQFIVDDNFITTTRQVTRTQGWGRRRRTVTETVTEPKNFRANDANYESSLELDVTPDNEIVVKSIRSSGSCGASDRQTDDTRDQPFIHPLRDGDTVPAVSGWNNQQSVETYLRDYTAADGKISLAENQIIYLFEMYTSTTGGTYDLQDNVVLVNIAPPNN